VKSKSEESVVARFEQRACRSPRFRSLASEVWFACREMPRT